MTAATTYTYDDNPPRRASLEDLGGDDFENDPAEPPDRVTMPNAEEANEKARHIAGLNRVNPTAKLWVTFPAGTPTINLVRGMRTELVAADFTVVDNGAGDTTIHWASSKLPTPLFPPMVTLVDDVEIDRVRAYLEAVGANQGVRVKTKLGATGTDCAFVIEIN
jgi:hypothetical protein